MGHLPARAEELAYRHHAGDRLARRRRGRAGLWRRGRGVHRLNRGIKRGQWDDRNVGAKRPRLIVLGFLIASVTVGLALLVGLGAPGQLSGYIACMLASVAVLATITTVWKISIHCAVASGSVTILALLFGPWLLPAYLLVALTGWSRIVLKDHTRAQVIMGSLLGAAAAALTYAVIPHQ
jgi:membrane-associated phospholipid phosphatase